MSGQATPAGPRSDPGAEGHGSAVPARSDVGAERHGSAVSARSDVGAERHGSAVSAHPDAVARDPAAGYRRAAAAPAADADERAVVSAQLGRPARGEVAVVHRCVFGLPTVVRVGPRLGDGTPFPTVFWLTCPRLVSEVGRLESDGAMDEMTARLDANPDAAAGYRAAAERYVAFRDALGGPLPGDPAAGGMPGRIKCLHAHAAHARAADDNPVGRWTLDRATPLACDGPCVDGEASRRGRRDPDADG